LSLEGLEEYNTKDVLPLFKNGLSLYATWPQSITD